MQASRPTGGGGVALMHRWKGAIARNGYAVIWSPRERQFVRVWTDACGKWWLEWVALA